MDIFLISVSYKTAPQSVRACYAYGEEQQIALLHRLVARETVSEAVILSTCNRTELYCVGEDAKSVFGAMREELLAEAHLPNVERETKYHLRYQGEGAVHHLFKVAAGLDSMVIGEDQILGQVRQALRLSHEEKCCFGELHTLFQMAVTAAKKVKTDTVLSKTSVSTASLALQQARQVLGTLDGKNMMILGASGQIGGILWKDALDIKGLSVTVTTRAKDLQIPHEPHGHLANCRTISYQSRYAWLEQMDVIVSATSSPHYTLTRESWESHVKTAKQRVLIDLAVPQDIDERIGELDGCICYTLSDMEQLARENNARKLDSVADAKAILEQYEERYHKELCYRTARTSMDWLKGWVLENAAQSSTDKAIDKLLYQIKDVSTKEELRAWANVVARLKAREE